MKRLAFIAILMALHGAAQNRSSIHDEIQSALENAARARRALKEAAEAQQRAELEGLHRGLLQQAPACAVAWNEWITKIGTDTRLRDYRDTRRFHAARRQCEKVFKELSKFYGKENRKRACD